MTGRVKEEADRRLEFQTARGRHVAWPVRQTPENELRQSDHFIRLIFVRIGQLILRSPRRSSCKPVGLPNEGYMRFSRRTKFS